MKDWVQFQDEDYDTAMNVEHDANGKVRFCLWGPTYQDDQNRGTSDLVMFDIDREQAIDIILLLEAAFA